MNGIPDIQTLSETKRRYLQARRERRNVVPPGFSSLEDVPCILSPLDYARFARLSLNALDTQIARGNLPQPDAHIGAGRRWHKQTVLEWGRKSRSGESKKGAHR